MYILVNTMLWLAFTVLTTHTAEDETVTVQTLDYLSRFGYYKTPDSRLGSLQIKDSITNSIKSLQRFAGLRETGQLDSETKALMKQDRCGLSDNGHNLNTRRKRRFTLQGSTWKKTDLTWRLVNDNNDGLSRNQVESALENAFGKWQAITNLKFQKLSHRSNDAVDIEIKFVNGGYHDDPYPFDGRGGTLAHAFYPHNNEGLSGDVHFDDAEEFTLGSTAGRNLLWVAVHEIGHSIGLEHSNVKAAIMYPWYRGNGGKDFDLNIDDIRGIQNIYGSRSIDSRPTTTIAPTVPRTKKIPMESCTGVMKAVFLDKETGTTYIINNDKVYLLNSKLVLTKGPIELQSLFPGMESADAVYRRTDGKIVLFKDTKYYVYYTIRNPRQVDSGSIFSKYRGLSNDVKKIDAAFIWSGNGRTYLFSGDKYFRYDEWRQSIDSNYPRDISQNWKGVPGNVDAVFEWRNGKTYFFQDKNYYRLNNYYVKVEDNYPRSIAKIWTQCSSDLVGGVENSGFLVKSSYSLLFISLISYFLIAYIY